MFQSRKRLGNAMGFRVSAEGPVVGVSTKYLEEPTFHLLLMATLWYTF